MALENKIEMVADLVTAAKDFFVNLLRPNMTLEKISEVVSPRLDDTIKKYEARGLEYSAGKFSIKYADEKHFKLEFEMYFRDDEGKWHKCANESEDRDSTLLEEGAWKTVKALKIITFPIEKPKTQDDEILQKDKNLEEYREAEREKLLNTPADALDLPKDKTPENISKAEDEKTLDATATILDKK